MKNFFYPLIENPYRNKDIREAIKVLWSKKLTIGPKTDQFQKYFSKKLKFKFSLMVNSGSSANLLAMQCLINPYRKKRLNLEMKFYPSYAGQHLYGQLYNQVFRLNLLM